VRFLAVAGGTMKGFRGYSALRRHLAEHRWASSGRDSQSSPGRDAGFLIVAFMAVVAAVRVIRGVRAALRDDRTEAGPPRLTDERVGPAVRDPVDWWLGPVDRWLGPVGDFGEGVASVSATGAIGPHPESVVGQHGEKPTSEEESASVFEWFQPRVGDQRTPSSMPLRALAIIVSIAALTVVVGILPADAAHRAHPPRVTQAPTSRLVRIGQAVAFVASASGSPKPAVKWQVSIHKEAYIDIPGATSRILRTVTRANDNGNRYRAVFSNASGRAIAGPAVLTVPTTALALGVAVFDPTYPRTGNQFQKYQSFVKRPPNILEWYQSWPSSVAKSTTFPLYLVDEKQLVRRKGLTPIISWSTGSISLNKIVAGATDGENSIALARAAALAKSYPGTLLIRLDWEMNGNWTQWNPGNAAQAHQRETPATFVAMWRHVVNYFRAEGVTNVRWVWAPNVDNGDGAMSAYYPGDGYVDYVGLDGYNYAYTQGGSWNTPQQVFGASYAELERITHKPVIITETSTVEADSSEASRGQTKALWIQQLSSYLPTLSNVVAVCWFDQPALVTGYGKVNFSVNSSAAALAAWEKYFVSNPEYHGTLIP
jgi:hypothetical protein